MRLAVLVTVFLVLGGRSASAEHPWMGNVEPPPEPEPEPEPAPEPEPEPPEPAPAAEPEPAPVETVVVPTVVKPAPVPKPPAAPARRTQVEIGPFVGMHRYDPGDRVISGRIVGLRAAVFPRDLLGGEFEVDTMPGESEDGSSPRMISYAIQAVARVRFPRLELRWVGGGGMHSVASPESIFRVSDNFLHWGATVAAPLGKVTLRVDVRHQIGAWGGGGFSEALAASAGLSLRLGD